MARLLIKNANIWHWTSLPTFTGSVTFDSTVDTGISGELVTNSWVAVNRIGLIYAKGSGDYPEDENVFDRVIDAKGGILLPGLMDSHIHAGMVGETSTFLDLSECNSIVELQVALRKHCRKLVATEGKHLDKSKLVIGVQWDQSQLSRFPTRHDLDEALQAGFAPFRTADDGESDCDAKETYADIPVFLWRACWHIGVGNSRALRLLNVLPQEEETSVSGSCNRSTVARSHHSWYDTPGGVIEEGADGIPTGILKERATEIVFAYMKQKKTREDIKRHLKQGLQICQRNGLTAVHTNDDDALDLYKQLEDEIGLSVRVFLTPLITDLVSEEENSKRQQLEGEESPVSEKLYDKPYVSRYSNVDNPENTKMCKYPYLYVDRIKIFSDGSLGAGTAAIRTATCLEVAPEAEAEAISIATPNDGKDSSAYTGMLIYSDAELVSMITAAKNHGYRVEIHAIGDAAAGQVLHAMEKCGIVPADRAVLTHCQVLGADLLLLIKKMGVICNVQPSFVPTDMKWVQERLATGSQDYAYIWKTLMRAGIHVAGGSDGPIEHCSPFLGMYDAIYREGRTAEHNVYKPEECLTFAEALYCYSIEGAFACQMEHVLGQIEVGFIGDFVLLNNTDEESPDCPRFAKNPVLNTRLLQSMIDKPMLVNPIKQHLQQQWMVVIAGRVKTPLTPALHSAFDITTATSHPAPHPSDTVFSTTVTSQVVVGGDTVPGKNGNIIMANHSTNRRYLTMDTTMEEIYCFVPSMSFSNGMTLDRQSDEVCKCCVLRGWLRKSHI